MRARTFSHFVGILGWPLAHTLSPTIQNAAFRHLSLDWVYLTWPVPPDQLERAVRGLSALGAAGANVTMPHKETVLGYLDDLSGDARAIGAVNTIQRVGEKLIGHNTDIDGFRQFLVSDAGVSVAGKRALVLGAGGAARAVVKALLDLGAAGVTVSARNPDRAEALGELDSSRIETLVWDLAHGSEVQADVVVNATPIGMEKQTRESDLLPNARWRSGQVVVDLVYEPPSTPLVEAARAGGADAWGGLGMLVHQAAASFTIWTGLQAPLQTMSAAAVHTLRSQPGRFPDKRLN